MRKPFLGAVLAVLLSFGEPASAAEALKSVKIGVLTDMSGPFLDQVGPGSVVAAELAIEDFARESGTPPVQLVSADHQNKPDIGLAIARRWIDQEGVTAIVDLPNSGVALGVANLLRERSLVALASSSMTSDLTGRACAPTTVQWVSDTWAQGKGTVEGLAGQGLKRWFFLAVDYALGQALERDARSAISGTGAVVAGSVRLPLGTTDYSSALLRVQASGADVMALASTGSDMINAIKQAAEFGLTPKVKIAPLFIQLSDVHAIGLDLAQGLQLVTGFYWDLNESTRSWSRRWSARMNGRMPTEDHAGVYSTTLAYLRAVLASGKTVGETVVATMKTAPIDDPLFGPTTIRPDGRVVHDMYLFEVKAPGEARYPYDYYRLVTRIPGDVAFRPVSAGGCDVAAMSPRP